MYMIIIPFDSVHLYMVEYGVLSRDHAAVSEYGSAQSRFYIKLRLNSHRLQLANANPKCHAYRAHL